ncbi:sensor histidine kinase [Mucilaginibacter litoreus]|uniref:histidine kinase n=1 Tax=Mucilaginibacter litoreus TaxID=1048221 RepID=A0ABW3ANH7_9SPHI
MKLSAHYNKAGILTSLMVLFIGGVIYYFAIQYIAVRQLDKSLTQALYEAEEYARSGVSPQQYDEDKDHVIFESTGQAVFARRYYDTVYFNLYEKRPEPARSVQDIIKVNGQNYLVTITNSREGTHELIGVIGIITLILITCLVISLFVINKYVLTGLWRPFFQTLQQVKMFNVSEVPRFEIIDSKVDEFAELNRAIYEMAARVKEDYQSLKQFTENASHELMTPLAVATTKLDILIQDESLNAVQLEQINDIYTSISRSARLNQSLLLLIKLENQLINEQESIDLEALIFQKISQFQELMQSKQLSLQHELVYCEIIASKYLIDIMLNNLLSNAIRHNHAHGHIVIKLTKDYLIIKNSGPRGNLNERQLFERFKKGSGSQGTGLGLAMVRKICSYYGYSVNYEYEIDTHVFSVMFN